MNIERLSFTDKTLLFDHLIGRVFHLTTRAAYEGIQRAGQISNNQSGCFLINTGSQSSYGRLNGHVCLFDLRDQRPEIIQNTLNSCYYFLGPPWFSKHGRKYITWSLVYLFLSPQFYNQLIPNSRVFEHYRETGKFMQAIPDSEVWIENNVPLSWIEKALLVEIKELAPDSNSLAGMYYWAALKASRKR